ncbi:MAG: formylglycine-generating enzyme family protein [Chloroflexi bacterium]|nr:formylglycine-generating enzyme family protein [Chloroflexota bacterium]MCL5076421.1 formylglycine-generating enzyme family protein [Chloroflexota bacterium]
MITKWFIILACIVLMASIGFHIWGDIVLGRDGTSLNSIIVVGSAKAQPETPKGSLSSDFERLPLEALGAPNRQKYADMVYVPAGYFVLGSSDGDVDETPVQEVYLDAFYIDKYEVTVGEFNRFVEAAGYKSDGNWSVYLKPGYEAYPVVRVSWRDANTYAQWAGKRLPTEAEWEKAARGTDGRKYPWGNIWDPSRVNSLEGGLMSFTKVDEYPRGVSPFGAYNMVGNVLEWTSSLYKPYPYNPQDGREDATAEGKRVLRGGYYGLPTYFVRTTIRYKHDPNYFDDYTGFRCVRDP